MNREGALGIFLLVALLGGILLVARRPASFSYTSTPQQIQNSDNIRMVPTTVDAEPRRYRNKETREIEYNADNLPTKITITRDYAVT